MRPRISNSVRPSVRPKMSTSDASFSEQTCFVQRYELECRQRGSFMDIGQTDGPKHARTSPFMVLYINFPFDHNLAITCQSVITSTRRRDGPSTFPSWSALSAKLAATAIPAPSASLIPATRPDKSSPETTSKTSSSSPKMRGFSSFPTRYVLVISSYAKAVSSPTLLESHLQNWQGNFSFRKIVFSQQYENELPIIFVHDGI